jgi:serine/threonine protein kinase
MNLAIAIPLAPAAFKDGLGERHHIVSAANEPLEVLTLREELTAVPSFESALRERVSRLTSFHHSCFGRVQGVERVGNGGAQTLSVTSERIAGVRLSTLLSVAEKEGLPLDIDAGLCLIRQLVQAVALLHETVPDVSHGAIGPERMIVTPDARLVIVEHVFGAALSELMYFAPRYWKDLRIPLPPRSGLPRFDQRADITQVGAVALALIIGRPLAADEYPARIGEIVSHIGSSSATDGLQPLPNGVRTWLIRALQIDRVTSFASAIEAHSEFETLLENCDFTGAPAALEWFLTEYESFAARSSASAEPTSAVKAVPVTPKLQSSPSPTVAKPAERVEVPTSVPKTDAPATSHWPVAKPVASVHVPQSGSEMNANTNANMRRTTLLLRRWLPTAAIVLIIVATGGVLATRALLTPPAAAEAPGTLLVNTNPPGVAAVIDGKHRGSTPLTLNLAAGKHVLELVTETDRRTIPVSITAGGQVSHFVELPKIPAGLGRLQVRTEPAGAKVTIDGVLFGRSPQTVEGLTPGSHSVVLTNELGSVKEDVAIEAGTTASLVVPLKGPEGSPVSGWISVAAPVDVQLFEDQRLLGSSRSDRIMVSVGRHRLEIVNETLGYRATRTIDVAPGQVSPITLELPKGSIAINALPWAEVWIDGQKVGETPIGSLSLPIGPHEIIFRHPELGEQRRRTTVTLGAEARVSADLRTK